LADKYKANDWYPTDLHQRAKINQYLHWHHHAIRIATTQFVGPIFWSATGRITVADAKALTEKCKTNLPKSLTILDAHLKEHKWVGGAYEKPTIADLNCYAELGQLQLLDIWDFKDHPNVERWLKDMAKIEKHDDCHKTILGVKEFLGKAYQALYPKS